jgi:hypothetical protein
MSEVASLAGRLELSPSQHKDAHEQCDAHLVLGSVTPPNTSRKLPRVNRKMQGKYYAIPAQRHFGAIHDFVLNAGLMRYAECNFRDQRWPSCRLTSLRRSTCLGNSFQSKVPRTTACPGLSWTPSSATMAREYLTSAASAELSVSHLVIR